MADYDTIMRALRNADAAGDTEAAKRLAQMAVQARADQGVADAEKGDAAAAELSKTFQDAITPKVSTAQAVARGFSDMATFGTTDEVAGFINSMIKGTPYEQERDRLRKGLKDAEEQHPIATMAGGVVGGIGSSLGVGAALNAGKATTVGARAIEGAKLGAIEGGAYGAGSGEGVTGRIGGAAKNAGIGGVVGGATPAALEGARRAVRTVLANPISNISGKANEFLGSEALYKALQRAGMSPEEAQAAVQRAIQDGQDGFTVADAIGTPGQKMLSGIARQPGEAGTKVTQHLQQRQLDQPDRVSGFIQDAFGFRGTPKAATGTDVVPEGYTFIDKPSDVLARPQKSAADLTGSLTRARGTAANEAYDAARSSAAPVDIRGALDAIDNRIGGMQDSGVKGDSIDGLLSGFRSRLASQPGGKAFSGADSVELSDFDRVLGVKQDVQDAIGKASRAGENNKVRELKKLETELDRSLEAASPDYRAANDAYREASRVIDAVDQGASMSRAGARATDTTAQFKAMNADQQGAARIGYGDRALAKVESVTSPSTNRAKAFTSTKAKTEADAMALDPDLFRRRIDRENQMWETFNRALGGSRTADNLADVSDTAARTAGLVTNVLAGRFGAAAQQAGMTVLNALSGQNEATRNYLADILLGQNVPEAIAPAINALNLRASLFTPMEAAARGIGREVTNYLSR